MGKLSNAALEAENKRLKAELAKLKGAKVTSPQVDSFVVLAKARQLALSMVELDDATKAATGDRYGLKGDDKSTRKTAHRVAAYCGLDITPLESAMAASKAAGGKGRNPFPYPDALFLWIRQAKAIKGSVAGKNISPAVLSISPIQETTEPPMDGGVDLDAHAVRIVGVDEAGMPITERA